MVDPFGLIPESVKERIHNTAVDGLARLADKLPGDRIGRAVRKLSTDAAFHTAFDRAVQSAVGEFEVAHAQIDADLVQRLSADERFWSSRALLDSLHIIMTNPTAVGRREQLELRRHFSELVGDDVSVDRLDDAIRSLLHHLSEQVWHLPQLQSIYSVYFQRIAAEQSVIIAGELRGLRNDTRLLTAGLLDMKGGDPSAALSGSSRPLEIASAPINAPAHAAGLTEQSEGDLTTVFAQYRQWLLATSDSLDIRDIGNPTPGLKVSLNLHVLYTPLHVRAGPQSYDPDSPRTDLDAVADSTDRLLITGESGAGKSTFLRHLSSRYSSTGDLRTPIVIDMVDLADEIIQVSRRRTSPTILLETAARRLNDEGISITVEHLAQSVSSGGIVWLLDGLNEIATQEGREATVELINSCARRWSGCKYIMTSNPSAVHGTSIPFGFEVAEIDEWRADDLEIFLEAWAAAIYPELEIQALSERWRPLLTAILETPELRALAKNALNVTAMAVVHFNEHRLPEGRADLLDAVTSWLINRRRHVLQRSDYTSRQIDSAFLQLAYNMCTAPNGPLKKVGSLWAARTIENIFDHDSGLAASFLDTVIATGGLLINKGAGDITFWNDSLRDYLAAKYIASKTDDLESGWWHEISKHLDDSEWQLIITLVPGCLARLGSDRVDLFFERLGTSCTGKSIDIRSRRVALGGRVLRDLDLSGYTAQHLSAWSGAVAGISMIFTRDVDLDLATRYEAAVAYGLEGDSRLADDAAIWVWLPGATFAMGSQADDPAQENYDRDAAVWEGPVRSLTVDAFSIRRYLVTTGEYRAFVDSGGYSQAWRDAWGPDAWEWKVANQIDAPLAWEDQILLPNAPVSGISWFESMAFCAWLTSLSSDYQYELPTEAEWEYAARRGVKTGDQFPWGTRMQWGEKAEANWAGCFLRKKSPVGMFPASTTRDGIADLFGNVEEWCKDRWSWSGDDPMIALTNFLEYYKPLFATSGIQRVVRGGSTIRFSRLCRPSYRSRILQEGRYLTVGFRPIRRLQ